MQKSRAIELLEHLAWDRDIDKNPYGDALNMAIDALKAQHSSEDATSDLISRQAAIDALQKEINKGKPPFDDVMGSIRCGVRLARNIIEDLPSAQPEPHEGYWIRRDCGLDVECKCSKCGYRDFVEPRDEYWFKRNYCPNCGAHMKGTTP